MYILAGLYVLFVAINLIIAGRLTAIKIDETAKSGKEATTGDRDDVAGLFLLSFFGPIFTLFVLGFFYKGGKK